MQTRHLTQRTRRPSGRPLFRPAIAALACGLVLGLPPGCSEPDDATGSPGSPETSPPQTSSESPTPSASGSPTEAGTEVVPRVAGTVATDLTTPWGIAVLPNGDALVAERDTGRIKRVSAGGRVTTVGTVPGVEPRGEAGLLGLAVAPTFAQDRLVYAYYTARDENRIVRMRYDGSRLGPPRTVLDGIPAGFIHNGGRMVFGPDGYLYVGTGEAGNQPLSQDRDSLGGKILRITPDGRPAPGNPFGDSPVWSYGHRNVQGLAFDPEGRLWASEFGQDRWDEVNLIRPGKNYGWPEVEGIAREPGFVDPIAQWRTDDASPSGLAYADGALWMAGLRGERLWRIAISRDQMVGKPQAFFTGDFGRLRTVVAAPGGGLWLSTSNTDGRGDPREGDDRILHLRLAR
ncbi:MAG TPA: PQQ-dependent sugar dehydrogenase [Actinopolymorphaceae bacterium]